MPFVKTAFLYYIRVLRIMISEQYFQSINNLHSPLNQPSFPDKLLINKYAFLPTPIDPIKRIHIDASNK